MMLIWTVQTKSVWEKIQDKGIFLTDKSLIRHKEFFLPQYKWMTDQMIKRLRLSAYGSDCLPVWGWYQYDGEKMRKPDLRRSGHLPKCTHGVRLELEKDPAGVLLSDFELWQYVLSYWYLPKSESDRKRFERKIRYLGLSYHRTKPVPNEDIHKEITESWDRIFDLEWELKDTASAKSEKAIQATFFEIKLNEVRKADFFKAR